MKILVAIPAYGKFLGEFSLNMFACTHYTSLARPDIRLAFVREAKTYRWKARETLGEVALGEAGPRIRFDAVWFLDDDTCVRHDTLTQLVEQDKDIVSALYFSRNRPIRPLIYKQDKSELPKVGYHPAKQYPRRPDKLFEVDGIGFGCALIKTDALEKIQKPWFRMPNETGEDFAFCQNARDAGFKVWVHSGIKVGHIREKIEIIDEDAFLRQEGYIDGLSTPAILERIQDIPGWAAEATMGLLCDLARQAKTIVELGVFEGQSLAAMMLANPEAKIYGIDIFDPKTIEISTTEASFRKNLRRLRLKPTGILKMTTDEAAKGFDKEIDLLHIDAGHEYEQVCRDIKNWTPKVAIGGVVCFDDYDEPFWPGVKKAVDEWRNGKWTQVASVGRKIAFERVA